MGIEQLGAMLFQGRGGSGNPGDAAYLRYYYDQLAEQDKRAYEQQQAESIAQIVDQIYGRQAQPERVEEMGEFAGPPQVFPAQEGTGLLGMQGLSPIQRVMLEREKAMLGSALSPLQEAALEDQDILMKSLLPSAPTPSTAGKMAVEAGLTPGTPQYQDFITRYAFKPSGTTIDMTGQDRIKVTEAKDLVYPDGRPVQPGTPWGPAIAAGVKLRNTAAGDTAGKLAMIETARRELPVIESMLFTTDEAGNRQVGINRDVLSGMLALTSVPGGQLGQVAAKLGGEVMFSAKTMAQANALKTAYEQGMQGITRLETGAAMPPEEVQNTRARFQPLPTDSDTIIAQKFLAFQFFLNLASEKLDPTITSSEAHTAQVKALVNEAEAAAAKEIGDAMPAPPGTQFVSGYD